MIYANYRFGKEKEKGNKVLVLPLGPHSWPNARLGWSWAGVGLLAAGLALLGLGLVLGSAQRPGSEGAGAGAPLAMARDGWTAWITLLPLSLFGPRCTECTRGLLPLSSFPLLLFPMAPTDGAALW